MKKTSGQKQRKTKSTAKQGSSVVKGGITRSAAPSALLVQVRQPSGCSITLKHREYVRDVYAMSGDGQTTEFLLSPTEPTTFPWLASIAKCFDYYRFESLAFHYVPRCSSTNVGSIMAVFDYDVSDSHSTDRRQQLAALEGVVESHVFSEVRCVANRYHMNLLPHRYCNSSGSDARLQAIGTFIVNAAAAINTDSTFLCGGIWVEYNVKLFSPQPPEVAATVQNRSSSTANVNVIAGTGSSSPDFVTDALGAPSYLTSVESPNGIGLLRSTALRLTEPGRYLLNARIDDVNGTMVSMGTNPLFVSSGIPTACRLISQTMKQFLGTGTHIFTDWTALVDVFSGTPSAAIQGTGTKPGIPTMWLQSAVTYAGLWALGLQLFKVSSDFSLPGSTPTPSPTSEIHISGPDEDEPGDTCGSSTTATTSSRVAKTSSTEITKDLRRMSRT